MRGPRAGIDPHFTGFSLPQKVLCREAHIGTTLMHRLVRQRRDQLFRTRKPDTACRDGELVRVRGALPSRRRSARSRREGGRCRRLQDQLAALGWGKDSGSGAERLDRSWAAGTIAESVEQISGVAGEGLSAGAEDDLR
jgi:hypothetical protein